ISFAWAARCLSPQVVLATIVDVSAIAADPHVAMLKVLLPLLGALVSVFRSRADFALRGHPGARLGRLGTGGAVWRGGRRGDLLAGGPGDDGEDGPGH